MQVYCLSDGTTDSAAGMVGVACGGIILNRGKCDDEKRLLLLCIAGTIAAGEFLLCAEDWENCF
ncbi:MAG: hypothetical protein K2X93_11495 [Candidatus Obscuribacterales bacterium]|nr:hypothetical protein [Candidatus Obscuribacterales bacterium]